METEILGVTKFTTLEPFGKIVPPVDTLYQLMVSPPPAAAEIETMPVPQREPSTAVGAVGPAITATVTGVLEADIQPDTLSLDSA